MIDDDEITLMLCEFILEEYQFAKEIRKFDNGADGLKYFEDLTQNPDQVEEAPELILLDLNMPVLSGWDFLNDFYTLYGTLLKKTKVILLSSTVDPEDQVRSGNYENVIGFLTKPLDENAIHLMKAHAELQHYFSGDTRAISYKI